MSLFESASFVVTPNGTKASKLYAIKPTDGSGDLTVVRATTATRVNASGVIETVGANVPRLDYTKGSCPSILVEPQRTNILLNSETLATQSITVTAQVYTLSFYGSGTVALSGTHSATVVGLGTARKTYTFTPTAGTLTLTITGTCTKGQLEAGSYPTSYIPTVASAVTRNVDVINKTGISSLIGQTEGTLFIDTYIDIMYVQNLFPVLFYIRGVAQAFIQINLVSGAVSGTYNNGTTSTGTISTNVNLQNGRHKFAFGYKNNDFVLYLDGVQIGSDTSGLVSGSLTEIGLQYFNNSFGQKQNTNIASLWKTRLSNNELAELTTI